MHTHSTSPAEQNTTLGETDITLKTQTLYQKAPIEMYERTIADLRKCLNHSSATNETLMLECMSTRMKLRDTQAELDALRAKTEHVIMHATPGVTVDPSEDAHGVRFLASEISTVYVHSP